MKLTRFLPLLAGVFLILSCVVPSWLTPTAAPVPPTDTPTLPLSTEPPNDTLTPTPPEPPVPTLAPPSGAPISHLSAGQAIQLTIIHMLDLLNGWAIGGLGGNSDHIFRTFDGGLTWRDLTPPEPAPADPSQPEKAVGTFLDGSHAWVLYYGSQFGASSAAYIWFTQDGGTTWGYSGLSEQALYMELFLPEAPYFLDAQHGWLMVHVGAGMNHDYYVLLGTRDGGQTWQTLVSPMNDVSSTQSCSKTGLAFVTEQAGWMTIDCHGVAPMPYFFKTQDGGATWERIDLPTPSGQPDLFNQGYCGVQAPVLFTPQAGDFALACVQYNTGQKTTQNFLYETLDGGANWNIYSYPGGELQFVDALTAFALSREIQRSDDAGHTWTKVKTVNWDGQFSLVDASNLWAVARDGDQIALVKSVNGGGTWQELKPVVGP